MRVWQHRARVFVAGVGIVFAIAVYAAMRTRQVPAPPAPAPERTDPTAMIESSGAVVRQVRGTKQEFMVKAEKQLTYEGGATKLLGVEVAVSNRGGRDYVIHAREAQAGERQQELKLSGDVVLQSSDGFQLRTAEAFFSEESGLVRAPGDFTFSRKLLTGKGTGMTYDRTTDVLTIVGSADIRLTDDGGNTLTQFLAGTAIFTRPEHLLVLGNGVHVLHNEQVADAMRASARLDEEDSVLQRVELRGAAEVTGSGDGLERLRGEGIDLDYTEGGQKLSHALIDGEAVVVSGGDDRQGRDIRGRVIDIAMAEDGSVSKMTARDSVTLSLPADEGSPSRVIEARQLDADGLPGGALAGTQFNGDVIFREDSGRMVSRVVRSRALRISLENDEVKSATFSGAVRFVEGMLLASGGTVVYSPEAGSLVISGTDNGGGPKVSDEQVSIDAQRITVEIASRNMNATGTVRTTIRPKQASRGTAAPAEGTPATQTRLPGLFEQGTAANGTADSFEYAGSGGSAMYSGRATLWQGETAVRGDRIVIDQESGDLRVTGSARSSLKLATGASESRSNQLSYADGMRTITYIGDMTDPAVLNGPDGDLRADRITVALAATSNRVERLEAATNVSLKLDSRTATGSRLTYRADQEEYVMTGAGRVPVKIVENCRETTGSTLTFYKSTDRIVIDGNEAARTQSVRGPQCSEPQRR